MEFSEVEILIDMDSLIWDRKFTNEYCGRICFKIGDIYFPDINAESNPANILRWLLRELRLCITSKVEPKERNVHYSGEDIQNIFINYCDTNVLTLKFSKLHEKKRKKLFNGIFGVFIVTSSKGAKEIGTDDLDIFCEYDDFFIKVYDSANSVFRKFCNDEKQAGSMLPLEMELKYSRNIYNKIKEGLLFD